MRYKKIIQKNLRLIHPIGKVIFDGIAKISSKENAGWLKQKIKIAFKETPKEAVSSNIERSIFNKIKDSINVVFDVGIQNELSFYKIRPNAHFHLFEPNQKFIKLIKKQIAGFKKHTIRLNEFGLSDSKQDNCIYYEESESFMVNPTFKHGDIDTGMRYSLETINNYLQDNNIPHIDFLKVDTEGFDYKVFLGGLDALRTNRVSYVQFEYWDGVKKFVDILADNFELYLMWEPRLMDFISRKVKPLMSQAQMDINYNKSLIPLDAHLIDLIDNKIIPFGAGGNIFGVNKKIPRVIQDGLIFDVTEKNQ